MPRSRSAEPRTGPATAIVIIGTAALAALWGVVVLTIGVFGTVNFIASENLTLPQPVKVPIASSATDATARLVEGTFTSADIVVSGASGAVRALLVSSVALDAIMHLVVAAAIVALCVGLMRGRPFRPSLRRMLMAAALALVIGGLGSSALLGFANMELAHELELEGFPMVADVSFTAALIGVVLALVVAAFELGERLQRDTDGLV